ncbi:MAG: pitrilysin family protein [Deltaproteobacteria bacterium]|nr:pitrilysin family protein [Deltaproteobacteria bacterium]
MSFHLRLSCIAIALVGTFGACATEPETAPAQLARVAPLRPSEKTVNATEKTAPPSGPVVILKVPERVSPDDAFRNTRPAAAVERPLTIPPVTRFALKNGLPVVMVIDHRLPIVHIQLIIKTGAVADPAGKAGLAELTANLLDEGTATRSALEIAEQIDQLGASIGTSATWDTSALSTSALTENLGPALAIWADVLLHPTFADAELNRVRENLQAQLQQRKDSPPMVAEETFARALYGDKHPYGWPSSGTDESLSVLKREDLQQFHGSYYKPQNAVLLVAGDVDETGLRAHLEPLLANWTGAAKKPPKIAPFAAAKKQRIYLVDKAQAPQSSIRIGLQGLARKTSDYHAALVMNEILGGSFRRLTLNLREKRGWTYGVYSRFGFRRLAGPWVVSGEFVADKTADSVREILTEIKALRDTDVPAAELEEAKASLSRAFPARFATMRSTASQLAELAVFDLPATEFDTFQKKVNAVKAADVRRMAKKLLRDEALVFTVVGDRQSNEAKLRAIADVELRDIDGRPIKTKP